jgi:predicted naringenin-chalcone synthase
MLRGCYALAIVIAASALLGCGGEVSAADNSSALIAAAGLSLSCTQVSPGRPANRQSVTATLDANGALADVVVRRGPQAQVEHSAAASTAVPGYQSGYFEQTYQLLAWNIGSEGENDYFLLLPAAGFGPGTFTAQLHVQFVHSDAGWWQKILTCTAQ